MQEVKFCGQNHQSFSRHSSEIRGLYLVQWPSLMPMSTTQHRPGHTLGKDIRSPAFLIKVLLVIIHIKYEIHKYNEIKNIDVFLYSKNMANFEAFH